MAMYHGAHEESKRMREWILHISDHALSGDTSALQRVKQALDYLTEFLPQAYPWERTFLGLVLDSEAKQERISELTGEILRLSDNQVEASKDDYHFAKKLTGMFRAVGDWAYQTFEDAPTVGQQLDHEAEIAFSGVAGEGWRALLENDHVLLITSVVTSELVKNVLEPRLLQLGEDHDYLKLIIPAIEESLVKSMHELALLVFAGLK